MGILDDIGGIEGKIPDNGKELYILENRKNGDTEENAEKCIWTLARILMLI